MFGTSVLRWGYAHLAKPIFFAQDPETVHDRMVGLAERLAGNAPACRLARRLFAYADPILAQDLHGIRFPNPVGLAGGFDKDARMAGFLPHVGFGSVEVGSVTARACAGNPRPRLWRLPRSQGLVVWYGLKNDGCEAIARRIETLRARRAIEIPLSVNIAKTNDLSTCDLEAGIEDYGTSFRRLGPLADLMTINVSCPNATGGEPFMRPSALDRLLTALDQVPTKPPVFLKFAADLRMDELHALIEVALSHHVQGLVLSNLTKDRAIQGITDAERDVWRQGGVGGRPVRARALALVREAYARCGGRLTLVGVGGISSAEDAYRRIRAGASLVQLVTGLVYEGPQLVGEINRGLAHRLRRDGFRSVAEAVGADHRP